MVLKSCTKSEFLYSCNRAFFGGWFLGCFFLDLPWFPSCGRNSAAFIFAVGLIFLGVLSNVGFVKSNWFNPQV